MMYSGWEYIIIVIRINEKNLFAFRVNLFAAIQKKVYILNELLFFSVDCLQCYVCNDCPKINDTFLVTCGGPVISTTMLPTTLTTTISNTNNDTITTVSNITTSALDTTIVTNATTPVTTGQTLTNTTTMPATPVSQINTTSASNDTINNSNKKILSKLQIRAEVLGNMFGDNISEYKASNTTYMYYCYEGKLKG